MRYTLLFLVALAGCHQQSRSPDAVQTTASDLPFSKPKRMSGFYSIGQESEGFTECGNTNDIACLDRGMGCWLRYSDAASNTIHQALKDRGLRGDGFGTFKMTIVGQRRDALFRQGYGHMGAAPCEIYALSVESISYFEREYFPLPARKR